jgi:hypothetical protein
LIVVLLRRCLFTFTAHAGDAHRPDAELDRSALKREVPGLRFANRGLTVRGRAAAGQIGSTPTWGDLITQLHRHHRRRRRQAHGTLLGGL